MRRDANKPKDTGDQQHQRLHLSQRKQGLMQSPGQNSRSFVTFIRAVSVLLYIAVWGRFMEVIDTEKVSGLKIEYWSVIFLGLLMS